MPTTYVLHFEHIDKIKIQSALLFNLLKKIGTDISQICPSNIPHKVTREFKTDSDICKSATWEWWNGTSSSWVQEKIGWSNLIVLYKWYTRNRFKHLQNIQTHTHIPYSDANAKVVLLFNFFYLLTDHMEMGEVGWGHNSGSSSSGRVAMTVVVILPAANTAWMFTTSQGLF